MGREEVAEKMMYASPALGFFVLFVSFLTDNVAILATLIYILAIWLLVAIYLDLGKYWDEELKRGYAKFVGWVTAIYLDVLFWYYGIFDSYTAFIAFLIATGILVFGSEVVVGALLGYKLSRR